MGRSLAFAFSLVVLTSVASAETPSTEPAPAAEPTAAEAAQPAPAAAPAQPAQPAPAAVAPAAPPPAQPLRKRLYGWGSVGTTFAYGQTYGNVSGGVGLLMQKGITPNVELSYNFGQTPTLWTLRPGVTWFMPVPRLHPYIGAYYTHWFVDGQPDQNGLGGRAGVSLGRVITLAVTYDHALNCSRDCDIWTPQISAGLSL